MEFPEHRNAFDAASRIPSVSVREKHEMGHNSVGRVVGLLLPSSGWDCRNREAIFVEFAFHILILGMT